MSLDSSQVTQPPPSIRLAALGLVGPYWLLAIVAIAAAFGLSHTSVDLALSDRGRDAAIEFFAMMTVLWAVFPFVGLLIPTVWTTPANRLMLALQARAPRVATTIALFRWGPLSPLRTPLFIVALTLLGWFISVIFAAVYVGAGIYPAERMATMIPKMFAYTPLVALGIAATLSVIQLIVRARTKRSREATSHR